MYRTKITAGAALAMGNPGSPLPLMELWLLIFIDTKIIPNKASLTSDLAGGSRRCQVLILGTDLYRMGRVCPVMVGVRRVLSHDKRPTMWISVLFYVRYAQ